MSSNDDKKKNVSSINTNSAENKDDEAPDSDDRRKKPKSKDDQSASSFPSGLRMAGVYGPAIRNRLKRQQEFSSVVSLPPRVIGGIRDALAKTKQCNCKRSHCLKLYCECFTAGIHCSELCKCVDCKNNGKSEKNIRLRTRALNVIIERNPDAFRPKVTTGLGGGISGQNDSNSSSVNDKERVVRGCNCKKSFCLKKYCECFQAGVYCSKTFCKCRDCKNVVGNEVREQLVMKVMKTNSHQSMKVSGEGSLIASSADFLMPPSANAVPLHFPGAKAPALSFGLGSIDGNPVEMSLRKPIHAENLPQQKNSPSASQRNKLSFALETDLEKKWRMMTEETSELIEVMKGNAAKNMSPSKKRALSEISSKTKLSVRGMLQNLRNMKANLEESKCHDYSYMESKVFTIKTQTRSKDASHKEDKEVEDHIDFHCNEDLDRTCDRNSNNSLNFEELNALDSQTDSIFQYLTAAITSKTIEMADERRRREKARVN